MTGNLRELVQLWLVHSTKFVVSGGCALAVLYSASWVPFFHMLAACVNGVVANVAKVVIKQVTVGLSWVRKRIGS